MALLLDALKNRSRKAGGGSGGHHPGQYKARESVIKQEDSLNASLNASLKNASVSPTPTPISPMSDGAELAEVVPRRRPPHATAASDRPVSALLKQIELESNRRGMKTAKRDQVNRKSQIFDDETMVTANEHLNSTPTPNDLEVQLSPDATSDAALVIKSDPRDLSAQRPQSSSAVAGDSTSLVSEHMKPPRPTTVAHTDFPSDHIHVLENMLPRSASLDATNGQFAPKSSASKALKQRASLGLTSFVKPSAHSRLSHHGHKDIGDGEKNLDMMSLEQKIELMEKCRLELLNKLKAERIHNQLQLHQLATDMVKVKLELEEALKREREVAQTSKALQLELEREQKRSNDEQAMLQEVREKLMSVEQKAQQEHSELNRLRQEIAATIPAFQAQLQQVSEVSLALQKDLEVKEAEIVQKNAHIEYLEATVSDPKHSPRETDRHDQDEAVAKLRQEITILKEQYAALQGEKSLLDTELMLAKNISDRDQRLITELETSNRELLARAARAEMDISDVKCRAERTEAALRQALDVAGQNELTLRSNLHKMLQDADARVTQGEEKVRVAQMQAESTRHQLEVEEEKSAKLMAYISQMELKMYFYAIPPVTPPVTRVEREVVDMETLIKASEHTPNTSAENKNPSVTTENVSSGVNNLDTLVTVSQLPVLTPKRRVRFTPLVVLLDAAINGHDDTIRELLDQGVDVNMSNEDGLTALHNACCDGSFDVVRLLLQRGANVNAADEDLWTPLHGAACYGDPRLLELLLVNGADPNVKNADGDLPEDLVEDAECKTLLSEARKACTIMNNVQERLSTPTKSLATAVIDVPTYIPQHISGGE